MIKNRDSWLTVSTSGELFMIVLTLVIGRLTSLGLDPPPGGEECVPGDVDIANVELRRTQNFFARRLFLLS